MSKDRKKCKHYQDRGNLGPGICAVRLGYCDPVALDCLFEDKEKQPFTDPCKHKTPSGYCRLIATDCNPLDLFCKPETDQDKEPPPVGIFNEETALEGEHKKNESMAQVRENNETKNPGWNQKAFYLLEKYLEVLRPTDRFKGEDFRAWSLEKGLIEPHDLRAYGPVMRRALRENLIQNVGFDYSQDPNQHRHVIPVYVKKTTI